jgi:hypothetical protein
MVMERVVVKAFMGVALNRWLIGTRGHLADITDDSGAEMVNAGREPLYVVGFPKQDVFRPESEIITDGSIPDWTKIRPRF